MTLPVQKHKFFDFNIIICIFAKKSTILSEIP